MTGQESSGGSSSSLKVTLLVACLLVGVLIFFVLNRKTTPRRASSTAPVQITGQEIVAGLSDFVFTKLRTTDTVHSGFSCDAGHQCSPSEPNIVPATGWMILGAVGLHEMGQKNFAERKLKELFETWLRYSDSAVEVHSLHQPYAAVIATNNSPMLVHIWSRMSRVVGTAKVRITRPDSDHPILLATLARQLALGIEALNDPEKVKILNNWKYYSGGQTEVDNSKAEFKSVADQLLTALSYEYEPFKAPPLVKDRPEILQYSCWTEWARLAMFKATGEQTYLAAVNDYLKRANFGERKQSELQVTSLQAILPCVDVLLNVDPGNSSNRAAARNLLETAAIPSLDRAPRILCNGDGAFLAVPRLGESDSLKCADNHKSTADNSWLLYLFSKMSNEKFNLYPSEAS